MFPDADEIYLQKVRLNGLKRAINQCQVPDDLEYSNAYEPQVLYKSYDSPFADRKSNLPFRMLLQPHALRLPEFSFPYFRMSLSCFKPSGNSLLKIFERFRFCFPLCHTTREANAFSDPVSNFPFLQSGLEFQLWNSNDRCHNFLLTQLAHSVNWTQKR